MGGSQGADEADVLGLGRNVTGNLKPWILPSIGVKEGAASMVFGVLGPSCTSCWAICRASTVFAYSLLPGSSGMDTSSKVVLKSLALLGLVVASG